ncbi:MAG: redox-regulated ATPase YchF [Candidatus Diapherotrites archaeon]
MIVGFVGKPSSGKSTLFNAATMLDVPMAAYPFTTIEANKGIGFVRVECADKYFNTQCNPRSGFCYNHTRFVPIEIIDVAGLVPGAHEGKGMGNQFLSDLSKASILVHVIDTSGSTNEKGEQIQLGSYDPTKDIIFLEEEITLWFLSVIEKNWTKFARTKLNSKTEQLNLMSQNLSGIGANPTQIEKAIEKALLTDKKISEWNDKDKMEFAKALREVSKPIIIAANKIDMPNAKENFEKLKSSFKDKIFVPCSAIAELTLKRAAKEGAIEYIQGEKEFKIKKELNEKQSKGLEYIKKNVLEKIGSTGVQEVLETAVFKVLKYKAIFPGGTKGLTDSQGRILPDCFLMQPNATALDFAFALHTDFGKNFIKAINVKTKQLIGKEHVLENGDVIEIVHGAK